MDSEENEEEEEEEEGSSESSHVGSHECLRVTRRANRANEVLFLGMWLVWALPVTA